MSTQGSLIENDTVYDEIRIWNANGWSNGFAPAPYTRITIGSSSFGHHFRFRQRDLSNSAWIQIESRNNNTSSVTWAQFRADKGDNRPRWWLERNRRGVFDGNPNVQFRTAGGGRFGRIFWSNSLRTIPPTSDNNPDNYKSNSGLLITAASAPNVTD